MTAGVAHQLKNGLAVLKGQGQLLKRAGHGSAAEVLLEETEELERLVLRFLQWAKPLDPVSETLRLEEVAAQAVTELKRRPVSQGRSLPCEGRGAATGDPVLLHQALVNLWRMPARPRRSADGCWCGSPSDRWRCSMGARPVRRHGPAHAASLRKRSPRWTGLGLPLALKWLNAQGADLRLSPRLEGGTRAEIRW